MAEVKTDKKSAPKKRKRASSSLNKLSLKKMFKDVRKPIVFIAGMYAGRQISLFIDKQTGTVSGITADTKAMVKPLAQIFVGLSFSQLVKNEDLKFLGYGVAANGTYELVKDGFGKDVLAGLGSAEASDDMLLPELQTKLEQIEGLEGDDATIDELEAQIEAELNNKDLEGVDDIEDLSDIDLEGIDDVEDLSDIDLEGVDDDELEQVIID